MKDDKPRRAGRRSGAAWLSVKSSDSERKHQLPRQSGLEGRLLEKILDTADDAIISIDSGQRIVLFNKGAEKTFGYQAGEVLGKSLDVLLPARFVRVHRQHVREFGRSNTEAKRMGERGQIAGSRKDGTEFPAEASISQVEMEGQRIFTVILRDITERKKADDQIKASLREKELLLKEIHHRVKNNLQVVTSLLNLQARGIRDDASRKLFKESQHRVHSMALIHEQLYDSKDLSRIDLPAYIRQLVAYLFRAFGVSSSRIDLITRIDNVELGIDVAVPCGLIINELVSNSLKYAFPEGRQGEIRIELERAQDHRVTLTIADSGVGFPGSVDFWSTQTLGLRLVRTLTSQLDGHIEVKNTGGAEVRVTFPSAPDNEEA